MNNLALKKKCPGMQGKLNWPGLYCSLICIEPECLLSYIRYFLQMTIWRLWQASVPFYSYVQVLLFIFVAFCD